MWYIVLSRSKPEMEEDKETHYDEHRLWLEKQHKAGRLLFSGPTTDGVYGIYIMLASSLDEAKEIAAEIRIMGAAFARWKCSNGTRAAPSGWTSSPSPMSSRWRVNG